MKDRNKVITALIPAVALAAIAYLLVRKKIRKTSFRKKERIADEGYETAGDILFPQKNKQFKYRSEWN